ncbi:MAG TPA: nuclear transport factor 2 family protein [Ilumatobacteraceae bacterium]|nr:nuclear transport factor 2 family protein [Ilumatobacteraceae bacterium]
MNDFSKNPSLEQLIDRAAVADVLLRMAEGIDQRDWNLYRSVFADHIELDYSSYRAENVGRWRADDWVARGKRLFPGLDASQHTLSNIRVELDGDTARATAYVRADHVLVTDGTTEVYTVCGRYDDRLVRTAGDWRICHKTLQVDWRVGDPTVLERAVARAASR